MKWTWSKKQLAVPEAEFGRLEFDESLMLIVDPEQLTSNLLSRLRLIVDVRLAFVYLVSEMTSPRVMLNVEAGNTSSGLPALEVRGRLVLWFQTNRIALFFDQEPDVMRYLHEEVQPLADTGINFAFPLVSMDRLIGIVFMGLPGDGLDPQVLVRMQTLGRQAGLAFENALLFRERLRQNERMFRAEQLATMGQFAAGIAHELRNPLTSIRSTVQFLAGDFDPDSRHRELAQGVLDEVDRLNGIIENLLTLAKPTDSKPRSLDMRRELEHYLQFVAAQARRQNVRIELDIDTDLPPVCCDSGELRQLLLNLVMNSIQAMPDGGVLVLHVALFAGDSMGTPKILVEVEDQGVGIQPAERDKVFDPFYTTKKGGTGLGLAICGTIVRRYGGEIWIKEAASGGTLVGFTLPAAGKPAGQEDAGLKGDPP